MDQSPISVRLRTGDRDEILGDKCRGLTFRHVSDGGYASGTLRLIGRWGDWDLGPNAHVYAYDARSGDVLWEGYTDNPGARFDTDGESFEIGVQGAMTLAGDRSEQLLYLDSLHENWRADDLNDERLSDSSQADSSAWPDTTVEALMLSFASGSPIEKGSEARMVHDVCTGAPMGIGGFGFKLKSGLDAVGYEWRITGSVGGVLESGAMSRATQFPAGVIGVTFTNAFDVMKIRIRRVKGSTNIGTDRVWSGYADPVVVGNRLKLDGTHQLNSLTDLTVIKAQNVVRDLVVRMMSKVDPLNSTVENDGTFQMDQLCYPEPVRASGVLEDLNLFEPDATWLIEESAPNERHEFSWRAWDTEPRYEISVEDGYDAPGAEVELCNRITVGYVGRKGQPKSLEVTQYVEALGGSPSTPGARVRDAERIDLDETISSTGNAQRIGEKVLALKVDPPKAATAQVVRNVYDRKLGCWVAPWRMRAAEVAIVRETGDELRITEVEVDRDDVAASLTLGEPIPTPEQFLARMSKPKRRKH